MKKQTKKQTAAKRPVAKPKAKPKVKPKAVKPNVKSRAKPMAKLKPKAAPKKSKPVVVKKSPTAAKPSRAKPVVSPPPIAEPITAVVPVNATLPPPQHQSVANPNPFEMEELRRIENALAEVENAIMGDTGKAVTINSVSAVTIADVAELLEELIDTASPKLASTISRLAYVLSGVMPGLQAVSKRADVALCRKCGVTFGWDRQAEAERAVRSGKYQKTITIS